ncbi:MAG: dephospho-CoA kinase [Acidobacteria bacterium]|nr:MAG: dephospho-CoA kinase [Acidobacteriota bacterium]
MYLVALTGGIGSGKSTVAARLVELGAILIDADAIAREVVEPGTPGLAAVVERFGSEILDDRGSLDRDALAAIVFADSEARKDLEAITHPLIGTVMAERMSKYAATDKVVLLDVPLLVEGGRSDFNSMVLVATRPDTQVRRLVELRGMTEDDARARIAAQASLEEKLARADHVIWNESTLDELKLRTDEVWDELIAEARAAANE